MEKIRTNHDVMSKADCTSFQNVMQNFVCTVQAEAVTLKSGVAGFQADLDN